MAGNKYHWIAEREIKKALKSGSSVLDMSGYEYSSTNGRRFKLSTLPESLGQLTNLKELILDNHELKELPDWLTQLTKLQRLNISGNNLTPHQECLGKLNGLLKLDIANNDLASVPKSIIQLTQLKSLNISGNKLNVLPDWIGQLTQLEELDLSNNKLITLPKGIRKLSKLNRLSISNNNLTLFPDSICNLPSLTEIYAIENKIEFLPEDICKLTRLKKMMLGGVNISWRAYHGGAGLRYGNKISSLPECLLELDQLVDLQLYGNPLNPELQAAYNDGLDSLKRYLRAKSKSQVVLNEAKLILIGEGEVGKSCLLSALRGDKFIDGRPTTHGIEIKPVRIIDPDTDTEIVLNGWDFGGQRVYRPTHQLFFSAPAVYLVVWKPREGTQAGAVKEWIKLIQYRQPGAKILVVATHGGPKERQPDIDRQELWNLFGKEIVIDFFHVESKPDNKGELRNISELKAAIARLAVRIPGVGREVPARWQQVREALKENGAAYLTMEQVIGICRDQQMSEKEAYDFVRNSHSLGHIIHYDYDSLLSEIVIIKPDWLATAISFVLDDKETRDGHGLVSFARLRQLWDDPIRAQEYRYPHRLHPVFLRLMERFDLSYRVAGFPDEGQENFTSLIAQLVPDELPVPMHGWTDSLRMGEEQQVQICRIVDNKGHSASAEGLFYQLIVRLHKYSLGRENYKESIHWQRGLVLDNDYNGRALMEHIGNDIRITVRAAFPVAFLSVLTNEVKWLVENFWKGLRCDVTVPCLASQRGGEPCGGLFEVSKLIENKQHHRPEQPCPICNEWQSIEALLSNSPTARPTTLRDLVLNQVIIKEVRNLRKILLSQHYVAIGRFDRLDASSLEILSKIDRAYSNFMQALTDLAKDGPRLFSFQPVDPGFLDRPKWINQKFRLTLWCEHSRLPLPKLNGAGSKTGVYELNLSREWLVAVAPYLKIVTGMLSLILPVASSLTKMEMSDAAYKSIEKELDFGQKSIESVIKGGEKSGPWFSRSDAPDLEHGDAIHAQGAALRQLHSFLKEKDPGFGGLVRVQNRLQEFLWVHPQFEIEY